MRSDVMMLPSVNSFKKLGIALFAIVFLAPAHLHAQGTQSPAPISDPTQQITCTQVENYGNVTGGSVTHPHIVILNLTGLSDNQYIYGGYASNWKDSGGGQNVSASYNAATGQLATTAQGFVCPPSISLPAPPIQK
jgi:hypothetical protein